MSRPLRIYAPPGVDRGTRTLSLEARHLELAGRLVKFARTHYAQNPYQQGNPGCSITIETVSS